MNQWCTLSGGLRFTSADVLAQVSLATCLESCCVQDLVAQEELKLHWSSPLRVRPSNHAIVEVQNQSHPTFIQSFHNQPVSQNAEQNSFYSKALRQDIAFRRE